MEGVPPVVWDVREVLDIEAEAIAIGAMSSDDFAYARGVEAGRREERERLRRKAADHDMWVPVTDGLEGRQVTMRRFLSDAEADPEPDR